MKKKDANGEVKTTPDFANSSNWNHRGGLRYSDAVSDGLFSC